MVSFASRNLKFSMAVEQERKTSNNESLPLMGYVLGKAESFESEANSWHGFNSTVMCTYSASTCPLLLHRFFVH